MTSAEASWTAGPPGSSTRPCSAAVGNGGRRTPSTNSSPSTGSSYSIWVPVVYGGVLFSHFGHLMLESLGRLWAYEHLRSLDPYIAFHEGFGRVAWSDERTAAHQVLRAWAFPLIACCC